MLSKHNIIVLNLIKHSEKGLVVQCYSLQKGREALYFKAGGKNKQQSLLLHKLALLNCVIYTGTGSSMPTIKEIVTQHQLADIRTNVYKGAISMFLCELIMKTIKEEEPNEQLFNLISSSVKILDTIKEGASNFHLYFMVNLCSALGFSPNLARKNSNDLFYIPSGSFEAYFKDNSQEKNWFTPNESSLMALLLKSRASSIVNIKCSGTLRFEFSKKMIEYIAYHLGCDLDIKSLDVLHQVFS